jgi:antagonist of KipI
MNIIVRSAGFLTSVQDLGRTGFRQAGVSLGGALDSHALRVANALVGNDDNAAGIEATLGTLRLHFNDERAVAWCGGAFAVRINGEDLPPGHTGLVAKDEELTMVAPNDGGRAWLAISGGIDVPLVLGSRSTDLRGNFGGHQGRASRDGDELALGKSTLILTFSQREKELPLLEGEGWGEGQRDTASFFLKRRVGGWSAPAPWAATADRDRLLRIVRGTHWDLFSAEAQRSLVTNALTVTPDSDRMGARLDGPELERIDETDILSEAVAPGTLQVPPNGKPILLLGDCQTIGGYPKIAHVITVDLPIAAQLWPGDAVRFHEVSLAEAQDLLREREEDFARFRVGLSLHFE